MLLSLYISYPCCHSKLLLAQARTKFGRRLRVMNSQPFWVGRSAAEEQLATHPLPDGAPSLLQRAVPGAAVTDADRLHRLQVGRSADMLAVLKDTRLFNIDDIGIIPPRDEVLVRRGGQAVWKGQAVFVLDTFLRYKVATADVAVIETCDPDAEGPRWKLGQVFSCPLRELRAQSLAYDIKTIGSRQVILREKTEGTREVLTPDLCRIVAAARMATHEPPPHSSRSSHDATVRCVEPTAAFAHVRCASEHGEEHHVSPLERNLQPHWVLDLPLPIEFSARPWRCRTCNNIGNLVRRMPIGKIQSLPPEASQEYFPVTDEDIRRVFPNVLVCKIDRRPAVYVTPSFFFELSQRLYECFNSREVRRHMASLYSTNALTEAMAMERRNLAPYALAWQVYALPDDGVIRAVLLQGLRNFAAARVEVMKRRQLCYNGRGIRMDGNFDLAKIIIVEEGGDAFTVVMGFCGLDGSLLIPPLPLTHESFQRIETILTPLLHDIKDTMLQAGYSLEETVPVFISTDNFRKHRLLLSKLIDDVWQALRIVSVAPTPKARATKKRLLSKDEVSNRTLITDDPQHKIIKVRRMVSPQVSDGQDFLFDFIEMINGLSRKSKAPSAYIGEPLGEAILSDAGRELLRVAVQLPKVIKKRKHPHPLKPCFLNFLEGPINKSGGLWEYVFAPQKQM